MEPNSNMTTVYRHYTKNMEAATIASATDDNGVPATQYYYLLTTGVIAFAIALVIKVGPRKSISLLAQFVTSCYAFVVTALQPRASGDDDDIADGKADGESKSVSHQDVWKVIQTTATLAKSERWHLLAALLISAAQSIAGIYKPVLQGHAIDYVSTGVVQDSGWIVLLPWVVAMAAVSLFQTVCEYIRPYLSNNIGDHVREAASKKFFKKVLSNEVGYFDKTHSSRLNRAFHSLHDLHYFTGHQVPQIVEGLFTFCFTSVFMVRCDGAVALTTLCFTFLLFVTERNFRNYEHQAWLKLSKVERAVNQFREESFGNVRTIKRFSCENKQQQQFEDLVQKDRVLREKLVHSAACLRAVRTGMMAVAGLIAWTLLSLKSRMSMGDITTFVALIRRLWQSAKTVLGGYGETVRIARRLKKAYDVMERATLIKHTGGDMLQDNNIKGEIELQNVTFQYPAGDDTVVLNNLSLTLPAGKVTALCGSSGGGKSTVASMVLRDYDPQSGGVYIDGVNVKTLDLESYHSHTAVVSQEPALFATTLRDNIAFGAKHQITQEEVERAAKLANAHDFITGFPKGYDTQVGERGVRLSGGQKQRIAIARAILIDPKILVLDESTSALDAECERVVQDALDTIMVGRTTLVIAHRLSTIRSAEKIVVLNNGTVVEEGNHDDLIKAQGHYASLVEQQLSQQPE